VKELGIDVFIPPGKIAARDVIPDTAGAFKLFCVPHEHLGMTGVVTVTQ
jgi:plastocyanin